MMTKDAVATTLQQYATRALGGDLAKVKDNLAAAQAVVEKTHGIRLSFDKLRAVIDERVALQNDRGRLGHQAFVGRQTAGMDQIATGHGPANLSTGPLFVNQASGATTAQNVAAVEHAISCAELLRLEAQSFRDSTLGRLPKDAQGSAGLIGGYWSEFEAQYNQSRAFLDQQLVAANAGQAIDPCQLQDALDGLKRNLAKFSRWITFVMVDATAHDVNMDIIRNIRTYDPDEPKY